MRKLFLISFGLVACLLGNESQARQSSGPVDLLKSSYYISPDHVFAATERDTAMERRIRRESDGVRTASLRGPDLSAWEQGPGTRKRVRFTGTHKPGSIIISTKHRKLLYVLNNGDAMMYGIGVGRKGFTWGGKVKVSRKAVWPSWTPPAEMHARQPGLPKRMEGGPANPLGARALYLGSTLYRIHGTNNARTIGGAVSSGCIRMMNSDVVDLYNRVPVGASVFVYR